MSEGTLPKAYTFNEVESKWYGHWQEKGYFRADENNSKLPFSIVIPPPNVTGQLHMGHALNNTLQDILCRYRRMKGFEVLWIPGTDHAGIATQNVVERDLASKGSNRHEVGRERFIELVWEWKAKYGGMIINQLKRLGSSCDWSRERFTMDEGLSRAVRHVFVELYRQGRDFLELVGRYAGYGRPVSVHDVVCAHPVQPQVHAFAAVHVGHPEGAAGRWRAAHARHREPQGGRHRRRCRARLLGGEQP
ncbi:MAG: class I tRNA ligase family protein [Syntrophobacteraceae bacterium]|nr:class I tRNA ligase family protein [Syntrophobacteraceae bacterium]